ncbi:hypothetical protein AJ80_00737 [Polytolypa hystricis UAMH7299]|uniref:37S ribosomal protein S25, mitochondrial n=1 Tax=Polytolypa hystricis (strain UAMH7299) TaxID=1447883 RepID=A0A2B7Z0N9_POLH7|nr:hypothetical protein AJ80_00737 [Polytolypa hystricis UAMH7299]
MGRYNFSALKVRQTAIAQVANGKIRQTPCWVDIMADIPPATIFVRDQTKDHPMIRQRVKTIPEETQPQVVIESEPTRRPTKSKKMSRMFQPVPIRYEEDQLRKEFFRDHPWELARPRVVLENDGKDYRRYDWSTLQQPGKNLDGESVVQRQLHLLNTTPDISKAAAYDIARREFYQHRLQQDVERKIAQEEAKATGAYFGLDANTVGMELENQVYDRFKVWAEKEAQFEQQRAAAFAGVTAPEATETETSEDAEVAALPDSSAVEVIAPRGQGI